MKRSMILVLALALTVGVFSALAGGMGGKTVEGTLVDSKCYLGMGAEGNDHKTPGGDMPGCGTMCAKMGIPTGLLTADGKYLTLAVPSLKVANYVGQTVRASGMAKSGTLIVQKLEVKKGSGWEEVNVGGMM